MRNEDRIETIKPFMIIYKIQHVPLLKADTKPHILWIMRLNIKFKSGLFGDEDVYRRLENDKQYKHHTQFPNF